MNRVWLMIASLVLAANIAMAADSAQTVTFDVGKMTCAACPIAVRQAMQRVDGVQDVQVDFAKKIATVIYDANKTTASEIAAASTNVGFPASIKDGDGA